MFPSLIGQPFVQFQVFPPRCQTSQIYDECEWRCIQQHRQCLQQNRKFIYKEALSLVCLEWSSPQGTAGKLLQDMKKNE